MDAADIARHRLVNLRITGHAGTTPAEVVAALGAIQAQDFVAGKWAIGLRLPGSTEADIERALDDGAIVRTWPMRGTLHFVAAADVRWLLRLLAPRVIAGSAGRLRALEIDDAVLARSRTVMTRALEGGQRLTRNDLYRRLDEAGISTAGQRGYHLLWLAAHEGLICFGPLAGKQQAVVLVDEWLPPDGDETRPPREEALARLAGRYVTSHGPATLADFARWGGLTVSDARLGLHGAAGTLARETIDGQDFWLPRDAPASPAASPRVDLLPSFDEYLVGYKERGAVLDAAHRQRVIPGSNGMFLPALVVDGRVAATWKRVPVKGGVRVVATPFAPLDAAAVRGFEAAASRYGAYLGLPVEAVMLDA